MHTSKYFIVLILLVFSYSLSAQTSPEIPAGWTNGSGGEIQSLANLLWLSGTAEAWDEDWILVSNIDASETQGMNIGDHDNDASTDEESMGFVPIAFNSEFTGTFDGQGYSIENLYINRPAALRVGLFSKLNEAEVKNLHLDEEEITGKQHCGGLAGYSQGTMIHSCKVSGRINASNRVGGIIGTSMTDSLVSCTSSSTVEGSDDIVGGIIGYSESVIQNSQSSGVILCESYSCGSLVGKQYYGEVKICETSGYVRGVYDVGGLIGTASNTLVEGCSSKSSVIGEVNTGGLIGIVVDQTDVFQSTTFTHVYGYKYTGGLIGLMNGDGHVDDCNTYRLTSSSLGEGTGGLIGAVGIHGHQRVTDSHSCGLVSGNDDVGGLIGNTATMDELSNCFSTSIVTGTNNVGGFIGKNSVRIVNCFATGGVEGWNYVGGLVGLNTGEIQNAFATGIIDGSEDVGGITGCNSGSTINNLFASGMVYGNENIGGIAGRTIGGKISNAYVSGLVGGYNYVGSITGKDGNTLYGVCWYDLWTTMCWVAIGFDASKLKSLTEDTMGITTDDFATTDLGFPFGDDDDNPWRRDELGRPYFYWQKAKVSNRAVDSLNSRIKAFLTVNGADIAETGVRYRTMSDTSWIIQKLPLEGKLFGGRLNALVKDSVYYIQAYAMDTDSLYYYGDLTGFKAMETTVTINESNKQKILIYPNPASDRVFVKSFSGDNIQGIHIYDLNGKLVQDIAGITANELTLDVGRLKSALYFVAIKTDTHILYEKLIIQE